MANVFRRIGKLKEAEKLNILSLQIEPNNPSALNNIGLLLMDENKFNLAIEKFLKALQFEQNSKTIKNLGIAYQRNFEYKKALNQYKLSLKINPKDAKTYCSLGSCFKELNQFNNAIEAFDKALVLEPSNIYALSQKKSTERQICLWDNDFNIDELNLIVTSYDQYVDPRSIMYLADNLEIEQKLARKYFKNNFVRQSKKINLKVKNKIRVGYYSADLITHAVTILIIRLFEIYDSNKFEIYVYNFGKNKDDKYTERIKRGVTIYRDVRNYTDSQIVDLSIKDEIDIAIDLMGYTKNCRPSIFSMRVAPIQISYLGFTGTMGTNAIDYIFADKVLIKENEKYFYDEKIIYLNNSPLCFDDTLKDSLNLTKRELYGLPEKGFIFSCFNNSYKISKKEFDTWMAILDKVETSYFWLFVQNEEAKRNLIKEAKCRNINEERIIFAEKVSLEEHFSRQKLADLFLDTFNHNAGSTGVLALYGGLPIITLYGNTYHSRMTASLLSNLDLYELISYSLDEYIEKTIKIATEKTYYSKIKNKLLNSIKKNNGSISKNFVEELESQYSKLMNN